MENVNQNPSPNYFAILPAKVRYCKSLEMGARILYAEITSLTHKEGYCWATNSYFSDTYQVDVRTIQRWLESLKKEDLIKVDIIKTGFQTQRKIWIVEEFKENYTKGQNCPIDMTKTSHRDAENAIHINKHINKHNKTSPIPSSKHEPVQKKVDPPNDDDLLRNSFKKAKLDSEQVERAVKFYFKNPKVKEANNPIGFVVSMVRQNKDKEESINEDIIQKRKEWAQKHQSSSCAGYLLALKDGIEKCSGSLFKFFRYDSNDHFWEGIGLGMNKMNLAT